MNTDGRLLKGSILGLVALVLLVGGATFALWFDSEELPGGEIASGELQIDLGEGGEWTSEHGPDPVDLESFLIVPGDTLTLDQDLELLATGDNLLATLTLDAGDISGDAELIDALNITFAVDLSGLDGITELSPGVYQVTGELGSENVPATVIIDFPETTDGAPPAADRSNFWQQLAQGGEVNLASVEFDLVQTAPTS